MRRFAALGRPAPVVVLGDALVDQVYRVDALPPRGGDAVVHAFTRRPGGTGLNVATRLARLGAACCLVTAVGDDASGRDLLHHLGQAGVDLRFVSLAGATGQVLSFSDPEGERTMFSYRGAAAASASRSPGLAQALAETPLLLASGYGLQEEAQAERYLDCMAVAREEGGLVAFDPSPVVAYLPPASLGRALALTDLLLPNAAELSALTGAEEIGEAVAAIMTRVSLLGLKQGARGSLVAVREGDGVARFECPVRPVESAETTGAGDAFDAGFLAALLRGGEPPQWGEAGNLAAREHLATSTTTLKP